MNVAVWHLTDKPTAPEFVAYWTNNGQRSVVALNGSAANDHERHRSHTMRRFRVVASGYQFDKMLTVGTTRITLAYISLQVE